MKKIIACLPLMLLLAACGTSPLTSVASVNSLAAPRTLTPASSQLWEDMAETEQQTWDESNYALADLD